MQPAKLEYMGKELSLVDTSKASVEDMATALVWESSLGYHDPQHIILEPGDGTRYEFVVAYHSFNGLYFMPIGKEYSFVVVIDLDYDFTDFDNYSWPAIDTQSHINPHTLNVYKWYLWNLACAMIEELNS